MVILLIIMCCILRNLTDCIYIPVFFAARRWMFLYSFGLLLIVKFTVINLEFIKKK